MIAVNQDPMGKQADLIKQDKTSLYYREIWGGPLSQNRFVYICFNRDTLQTTFTVNFNELLPSQTVIKIREIIDKVDVAVPTDNILKTRAVRGHSVAMYIVTYK